MDDARELGFRISFSTDRGVLEDLVCALGELSSRGGMVFETPDERRRYFDQLQRDPEAAQFGDSLRHARYTHLGIWSDSEALYQDCAKLMAAELNKACRMVSRRLPGAEDAVPASRRYEPSGCGSLPVLHRERGYGQKERKDREIGNIVRGPITTQEVASSRVFRKTFDTLQRPNEAALHNLVRALGANDRRMERMLAVDDRTILQQPGRVYTAVLREITDARYAPRGHQF